MIFGKLFIPERQADGIWDIDFQAEYDSGFRAVIFDIDNTLVPHDAPATKETADFFRELREIGFMTCLISNNQESRVKPFADVVDSLYLTDAEKPSRKSYRKAMKLLGTNLQNTLFVGDQLLTDVLGARRLGMHHIMVDPVDPESEPQHIKFKRVIEKIMLFGRKIKRVSKKDLKKTKE